MPIYNQRPEERQFFEEYFSIAAHDVAITPERTAGALEVASHYGMNACDALHIEAARVSGAAEFITTEKPTKPFFRVAEGALVIVPLVTPDPVAAAVTVPAPGDPGP